jgi:hypothetical protein
MRFLLKIASDDNSAWRKLGKMAVEKAVETVVEEGIEAAVEIWKKRQLKFQDEYFEDRQEARDGAECKEYPTREDDDIPSEDSDEGDGTDGDPDENSEPVGGDSAKSGLVGHSFDSLSDFAARSQDSQD